MAGEGMVVEEEDGESREEEEEELVDDDDEEGQLLSMRKGKRKQATYVIFIPTRVLFKSTPHARAIQIHAARSSPSCARFPKVLTHLLTH